MGRHRQRRGVLRPPLVVGTVAGHRGEGDGWHARPKDLATSAVTGGCHADSRGGGARSGAATMEGSAPTSDLEWSLGSDAGEVAISGSISGVNATGGKVGEV